MVRLLILSMTEGNVPHRSEMVSLLLLFYFAVVCSLADDNVEERNPVSAEENEHSFISPEVDKVEKKNIENALKKIETIAASAEKYRREGILPAEHVDQLHRRMVSTIEDITEQLKDKANAYKFLNSKGVDRILTPTIGIKDDALKEQLLILIKTLFDVAPVTTNDLIPISVIDKLLDIFEHDGNLALKSHALDIMHVWLPNSPIIQARVMKLKGLEPFYDQVSKLDVKVIHTLLDLLNKILEEHTKARDNKSQRSKEDYDKMQLYQKIGLIERMSTPQVCNGLFNILESLMAFTNDDTQISNSVFKLVKNMKKFCLNMYKGKEKAIKLFDELKEYVKNPQKIELMRSLDLNVTDIVMVVEDFTKHLKANVRDEF